MCETLVIDHSQLCALATDNILIVDLSDRDTYLQGHIPGAVNFDPSLLNCGRAPVPNLLPDAEQLSERLSALGVTAETKIVAYDHQLGALAGRFIWTLHIVGHRNCHFLNGQFDAWINAKQAVEQLENRAQPSHFKASIDRSLVAGIEDILAQIESPQSTVWDARSPEEYDGSKIVNAQKGGHIPGALNLEWTQCLIPGTATLLAPEALREKLAASNIDTAKDIITHCQTHRRSGLTYIAALQAGVKSIRCYDGSWFEWGNHPDTPVES
ncbi:MAG: sulfurtransferase [Pseudomonadales bacterium]